MMLPSPDHRELLSPYAGSAFRTGEIEPGDRGPRPPAMRQILSTVLRLSGWALGLAAGGVLIALMWPDVTSDLYSSKALRHVVGMFTIGIVLAFLISWPFCWVADKLSPESGSGSADVGTPT
jgi:hypothetical protein